MDLRVQFLDAVLVARDEVLPTVSGELRYAVEPERVELGAEIVLEEVFARNAVILGEPHEAAFVTDQPLVDVLELLNQRINARSVQA